MTTNKTLLLIEDNNDLRENTAEILELAGYEVLTAENGKVGVNLAQTYLPSLIICDIMMPELDGYGVLHILGRNPKTAVIPFVFLSAKAEKTDFRKGMNMGADDYLTKPFSELDLLDTINRRLEKASISQNIEGTTFSGFVNIDKAKDTLNKFIENYESVSYGAKYLLYLEDTYPRYLFFVKKGKVKTYRLNDFGKELMTGFYTNGDFMAYSALFKDGKYTENAVVLEDSELIAIPKDDFFKLVHNDNNAAYYFIVYFAKGDDFNKQRLLATAYSPVRERVAIALLYFCEKYEPGVKKNVTLDISREDLANFVGTSKETVIRTLSDFKSEKFITTKGRYMNVKDVSVFDDFL